MWDVYKYVKSTQSDKNETHPYRDGSVYQYYQ
jgi:hypothetical protein